MDELESLIGKNISEIDSYIFDAFEDINVKVAILEYKYKNCGMRYPAASFRLAGIDFTNPLSFDKLFYFDKIFIFWHFNGIITDLEFFDISLDRKALKKDYDFIIGMIENDEAHNLRAGDTDLLAAKRLDNETVIDGRRTNKRDFALKVTYLQRMLNEINITVK